MAIRDLVPRLKKDRALETRHPTHNLFDMQRSINRLFEDFFDDTGLMPAWDKAEEAAGLFNPSINVAETEKEITATAELPGLNQNDVQVEVENNVLSIRGEKKQEKEEKNKHWHRIEHSYGSFHRAITLPANVDSAKAKAAMKNGVLSVTIPKLAEENKRKAIEVSAG